ncbi:MAG: NUDIX hydrolase [Clostridia bacterium]|nr:NUDIX hydrolase [Clostridia bacterium]
MTKFHWVTEAVPEGMAVRQVYCIMLDRDGRVMLRVERKPGKIKYSLAGGRPEAFDRGIEGTCRREVLEEVNTEIETPVYIGYQLVNEGNGSPAYAQVRMAALIRKIGEKKPDPDNGKTYDRFMVTPEKAASLLNWGEVGYAQVMKAKEIVYSQYGIAKASDIEEWV